jgi:Family of unknown function (DUF5946)
MTTRCPECGAAYASDDDSCAARFEQLLALDHSRQEPWGSRHGQAFAAFALQHPARFATSLDHAWAALHRIYVAGDRPSVVFERLRANRREVLGEWNVTARLPRPAAAPSITIADLGDFDARRYADRLDAWCRATLSMWGAGAHESVALPAEKSRP